MNITREGFVATTPAEGARFATAWRTVFGDALVDGFIAKTSTLADVRTAISAATGTTKALMALLYVFTRYAPAGGKTGVSEDNG